MKKPQGSSSLWLLVVVVSVVVATSVLCVEGARTGLGKDYINTPIGRLPPRCVHKVRSGSEIEEMDNGVVIIKHPSHAAYALPPCSVSSSIIRADRNGRPFEYDGWLAYTTFHYATGMNSFLGYFTVPNAPQSNPEVLYIFTGLQNVDWIPIVDPEPPVFDIIQPVLQYPGDDGNYWSVKSWYVTLDSGVVVSDEIEVAVGDNIFGNMTKTGLTTWYIGGVSSQTRRTSAITVTKNRLALQPWAYNTLECYGCGGGCPYEPTTPTQFTKLQIQDNKGKSITPQWVPHTSPNRLCHEKATINSPTSVTISFQ